MKRQVFFSFHYKPDNWRASQVREMGTIEGNSAVSDNDWETARRRRCAPRRTGAGDGQGGWVERRAGQCAAPLAPLTKCERIRMIGWCEPANSARPRRPASAARHAGRP